MIEHLFYREVTTILLGSRNKSQLTPDFSSGYTCLSNRIILIFHFLQAQSQNTALVSVWQAHKILTEHEMHCQAGLVRQTDLIKMHCKLAT